MKHLIIGYGEVGKALKEIITEADFYDQNMAPLESYYVRMAPYDVLHVCIPDSDDFVEKVQKFYKDWGPALVIIHSTTKIGTTEKIGEYAVHSPIRGVHPHLAKGIRTLVKYFGGPKAREAADIFMSFGINVATTTRSRDTEALKLWDTTQYGWQIILMKSIWEWCKDNDCNFDLVYQHANYTYNDGYMKLGKPEVVRPYLNPTPGPIGGHCVIPNCDLLDSDIATIIKQFNEDLKGE